MVKGKEMQKLHQILENAMHGQSPGKEDCIYLLSFDETSIEASFIRSVGNEIVRKRTGNSAAIAGQIGISVSECNGGCKFCTFGAGHTTFAPVCLTDEEIHKKVSEFCDKDDLHTLLFMTMHDYDVDHFLNAVKIAKSIIHPSTNIRANVGDTDIDTFREMKKAGVDGVYHVWRIGEGIDTDLQPKDRLKTIQNALDAGLCVCTCCEPIGPEHSPETLVEHIFAGINFGCTQLGAMRRVAVPGTPLAKHGQISELRLAQIVAVVAVAHPNISICGVHEPNKIAYTSGANCITAESGANPRDNAADTKRGRGLDMNDCRKYLLECGFSNLMRGDGSKIPLTFEYATLKAGEKV